MGRSIVLSVLLMLAGGTGFARPDWIDIYDLYGTPSSGSLGLTSGANIHNAGMLPHPALQFKDRWLFDYAPSSRHPHRQHHHRGRRVVSSYRSPAHV
jgi:hypothetical protein